MEELPDGAQLSVTLEAAQSKNPRGDCEGFDSMVHREGLEPSTN